jgi:hypothetical protein
MRQPDSMMVVLTGSGMTMSGMHVQIMGSIQRFEAMVRRRRNHVSRSSGWKGGPRSLCIL